ncbi:MAG: hypothetical protein ACTSO7_12170 [Candidatus Heimdallarchaeota archaeon]
MKIIVFVSIPKNVNLYPLNKNRPAALFQVAGKNLLEWYQSFGEKNNCDEIILLVDEKEREIVRDEVSRYMLSSELPNKIGPFIFYDFDAKKGLTKEIISNLPNEVDTLLINGDIIFTEEYLSNFLGNAKKNTILIDKKEKKCLGLALLAKVELNESLLGAKDINDVYQNLLAQKVAINEVVTKEEDQFWKINYLWNLLDANEVMIKTIAVKRLGTIEDGVTIIGKVLIDEGARIRSGSYLEGPLYVGRNCDIGPNCYLRKGVSLGEGVRIGNACELKNTIISEETHVAHLSYVGDSIIGSYCNFGAGTITGNLRLDDKTVKAQTADDVVLTGRRKLGVIMGDHVKTAINTFFMPGVIIGNNTGIGTGVIVNRNIDSNTFVYVEQKLATMEWTVKPKKKKKG